MVVASGLELEASGKKARAGPGGWRWRAFSLRCYSCPWDNAA